MESPSIRDWEPRPQRPDIDRVLESELTPTGQNSLVRLRRLLGDDLAQQMKHFASGSPRDDPDPNVMQQRYQHRELTAALFRELIRKAERPTAPSWPVSQQLSEIRQLEQQNALERSEWIDRFEKDVILDKTFLEDSCSSYRVYARVQRERQIAKFISEVSDRQDRWLQAVKLVLKFKADEQIRKEAQFASLLGRVASLAPELLIAVVEACVESQYSSWDAKDSTVQGLTSLAGTCFKWPRGVTQATRNILKLEAAGALIKNSIVKIPMSFSPQNTIILPPLLVEREHDLRHLSLDLHTTPANKLYNRKLNKAIKSMAALGESFPKLEVLVLSLYLHSADRTYQEVLRMQNIKRVNATSGWGHAAIEDTVIELIAALAQSGPGKRKLIRFGSVTSYRAHQVGPLVKVSNPVARVSGQAVVGNVDDEINREEVDPAIANAKNIFDQGHHAPWTAGSGVLMY